MIRFLKFNFLLLIFMTHAGFIAQYLDKGALGSSRLILKLVLVIVLPHSHNVFIH